VSTTDHEGTAVHGRSIARWLRRRANDMAVVLIATMFVSFLLQILFRYVFNRPLGWTEEVTVLCWVWVVLWGASFVLDDVEEVRFDIVYNVVPPGAQRAFTIASSLALVVLLALSLPGSWRYVAFMSREHSAYFRVRFDLLYSIYIVFALACIVRQVRVAWRAWHGRLPTASHDPAAERAR
jgi:TRAP-type C4-dicarboxylate transport system permease small subunit